MVLIRETDRNGKLIRAEGYLYDDEGRRSHSIDEEGKVTIYEYDNQSRISTVLYPYTEEKAEADRREAEGAGQYFTLERGAGERYMLSGAEVTRLREVLDKARPSLGNAVTASRTVWRESYTYDLNGNRVTKTTPWGTIGYSYDDENRLIRKGDIVYSYDKEGNLIREEGVRRQVAYEYNGANRMVYSEITDTMSRSGVTSRYGYDGLGRRTAEQDAGGAVMRVLYDGLSFEVIREGETYRDGSFTTRYGNGGAQINDNRGTEGSRYRWVGEGTNGVRTRSTGESEHGEVLARWTGTKVTLYGKGEAVSISVNGGSGVYLGKDVMGSVRSVSNGYGSIEERYEYDAFGEPYRGDLTGGMNLAYTGKPYDTATGLYNYGYRDYSPALARFTTADPVRDGTNWFAYVNNDPVNWIDPWGLSASDKRTSTAYMIPLLGAGATIVVGANVTLSYVFDTAGNKGIAISGDIGVGVSASVDLPVSTVVNMLLQEISTLSGTTSIPGKIQNFAGPYAVTNVHLGLGLTQDINNPKDTRITFDTAIGGGSYIGYTYVIEFFDGDGEK